MANQRMGVSAAYCPAAGSARELAATAVFCLIVAWNEFLFALDFSRRRNRR